MESGHPEAEQVAFKTQDLQEKYDNLKKLSDDYKAQLDLSLQAKQVWPDLKHLWRLTFSPITRLIKT